MNDCIHGEREFGYRDVRSYRFQLTQTLTCQTGITVHGQSVESASEPGSDGLPFVRLDAEGNLAIHARYSWDGPSFIPGHARRMIRGSLVHDALYQLIRDGCFPVAEGIRGIVAREADILMRKLFLADGTPAVLAWFFYAVIRLFGRRFEEPGSKASPPCFRFVRTGSSSRISKDPGGCEEEQARKTGQQ